MGLGFNIEDDIVLFNERNAFSKKWEELGKKEEKEQKDCCFLVQNMSLSKLHRNNSRRRQNNEEV